MAASCWPFESGFSPGVSPGPALLCGNLHPGRFPFSDAGPGRVDVRVLPVLFRFKPPKGMQVYPGQLVDVYVETK
jgi:hypothetical protein